MFRQRWTRFPILACTLAGLASGCGVEEASKAEGDVRPVKDVGKLYRMYALDHKKPPEKPTDLQPYQDAGPDGFQAVKNGDVVVVWGVTLTDLDLEDSKDSPDQVLAFEKKVPDEGGTVLMKNRTVRRMTAEEFKDAPKAGGS
jgi:hypothetical protein